MLALIAGRGRLPATLVAALEAPPLICALEGTTPDGLTPDITFRIETLGTLLLTLGERGVSEICLCGAIDRPVIDPTKLDAETLPLVPLFQQALAQGDDGALRLVIGLFEQTGFAIRAAHEVAPSILPPAGVLTRAAPHPGHRADVQEALMVLADQDRADLGQACVVRRGAVLAREDARGTDAMLAGLAQPFTRPGGDDPLTWAFDSAGGLLQSAADWLSGTEVDAHDAPGAGAILFKAPKPGQDLRADLPTIGPATAMRAAEAGLDGIVIAAGGVIVLDQPQVLSILDAMGLFLWVR